MGEVYHFYNFVYSYPGNTMEYIPKKYCFA